jgi:RHS repeat-associated protein
MRIQWDTSGDADPTVAVKPVAARGSTPFRAALRAAEQWTDLGSQEAAQRLADQVGSSNFTFSAPVAHYPGRGDMSLNLDLVYNSRVWQRTGPVTTRKMVFDIDDDWPAPGWSLHMGQLVSLGVGAAMVVEPDGTRRPFKIDGRADTGNDVYVEAHTIDGRHILYQAHWRFRGASHTLPYLVSGWLVRSDGTRVDFEFSTGTKLHATRLTDRNGNTITVEYDPQIGHMKTITDTCGRVIKFAYRELGTGDMVLAKVIGPAPNQEWSSAQTDTDLVVLNIGGCPLRTSFADPVHEQPAWSYIISGLYYPATHTGYWLPTGSYSSYGMLKRVQACRRMSLTSVGASGTTGPLIVAGPVSWQREYNYPDAPGPVQNDVPTYTTMAETWAGRVDPPLVTGFSVQRTADRMRTELTWPDGAKTVRETSLGSPGEPAGLLKELRVLDPWGKELQRTHVHSWNIAADGTPQVMDVYVIDEAGHLAKTTFAYGTASEPSASTQPTLVDQWEYTLNPHPAQRVLRRTHTKYVDTDRYMGRNMRNMPEWVRVYEPFEPYGSNDRKVASLTEYYYDQTPRGPAPGIIGFDERFNPASPTYVPATAWRGNPTTIHRYSDAAQQADPVTETRTYDVCGNLLTTDIDVRRVQHEYRAASRFLTPETTWLTGTAPSSPKMALATIVKFTWAGQPAYATDANGHAVIYEYDTAGRLTLTTSSTTGSETRIVRDDAALTLTTTTRGGGPGGAWLAGTATTTFDGRGRTQSVRTQRPDGGVTVTYGYDFRDRLIAVTTPRLDGEVPTWDSVDLDQLGRPLERIDFDKATTRWCYNEAARPANRVTTTDEAFPTIRIVGGTGTERWMSFDGLKRLREIVSPGPDGPGTVVPTGALCTSYRYDGLGNVAGIDLHATGMPLQQRRFRYDSLGRLVRRFLPEHGAGIAETRGSVLEQWSTCFTYDTRSNLIGLEDSRGILVRFDCNDSLDRIQHVQYSMSGFRDHDHPVVECPDVTYTYESTGDLRRVHQEICPGVSTQVYAYGPVFGLTSATVTMDSAPQHPFTIDYGHDQLGRPTTTTLPAQYGDGAGNQRPVLDLRYRVGGLPDKLSVVGFADLAHDIAYTPGGQISSVLIGPEGVKETYAHDRPNPVLVTGQSIIHDNVTLLDVGYEYNPPSTAAGLGPQVRAAQDLLNPDGTRQGNYDRLGRLDDYAGGPGPRGTWGEDYGYDLHGNRATVTARGDVTPGTSTPPDGEPALAYDGANRITNAGFTHDAAGNVVAARIGGVDFQYMYDAAGRLAWVHNGATDETTGYVFGACGRRRATVRVAPVSWPPDSSPAGVVANQGTSTTFHIWDADRVVATYDASGPDIEGTLAWKELSLHLGQRLLSTWENSGSNVKRVRYHHPGLTGTRYVTGPGPAGQPYEHAAHESLPFGGSLVHDAGTTRTFTSYERDPRTGLDYAVNRFYHPALGRFLQPDPIGATAFRPQDTQTLNGYAYCGDDPINRTDPLGLRMIVWSTWEELPWGIQLVGHAIWIDESPRETGPGNDNNKAPGVSGGRPDKSQKKLCKPTVRPIPSIGFQVDLTAIAPFLSGGGGTVGVNVQWTPDDGLVAWAVTPTEKPSWGISAGIDVQAVFGLGSGSWAGPFESRGGSAGPFGVSTFNATDGDSSSWSGVQGGLSIGPIPVGFFETETNYSPLLTIVEGSCPP